MVNGGKRAIEIAHRRFGKDEIALAVTCELAHKRVGNFWHCLPEFQQGRKAIWTAVNAHTGKRRIDEAFPPEIRKRTNDQEMFIEFLNGSTWQIIGSDRYDATVGAGVAGIVYSEWALSQPSAWAYHRPMLTENDGFAMFITTPRGRNHAYSMYNYAKDHPETWFSEINSIYDTKALTKKQIEDSKSEYIALYGEDIGLAQFQQEYECSFNAAILGAFYGREMALMRQQHRITDIEAVPWKPIHTAWDIGVRDDTSIWFFQVVSGRVFVLDCYSDNGGPGIEHYAQIVRERCEAMGVKHGTAFVPHDAKVREWASGKTRIEQLVQLGLNPQLCVNASKLDGINATRMMLQKSIFHNRCDGETGGIAALEMYRREWDETKSAFKATEVHDWSSHLADAARYMALSWRDVADAVVVDTVQEPPPGYFRPPPVVTNSNGRIKF